MNDFPCLETDRLRLREITVADAADILAIHGDPVVMRWMGTDPTPDLAAAIETIEMFASSRELPHPGIRWGLQSKEGAGLIGSCGFFARDGRWKKCMLGYELATDAWGMGYMREALVGALRWAFANTDLHRIEAIVHPDNAPSRALLRSLKFEEEGRLRECGYWGGQRHDMLMLSLLRHEFCPTQ